MTEQCQEWIAHCVTKYPCKGSVLEVGSFDVNGNPRHHFADKERFENYIGVDMREGPCVDKVMNVQALDFADNSFGVIVDAERLEHDNRFWLSVKELYRVLKPGGHIIVTTRSWGGMHPHAYPHDYWRFMDSGLKDLLEYAGFNVLATAYGERWAGGDKAVFAVARKPIPETASVEAPYSIVIPSANAKNLIACVLAIRRNEPHLPPERIIVVNDGAREAESFPQLAGITWVEGEKPFIFARNANCGIKAANSGVILLNDDALLETMYGFTNLWKYRDHGLVSAAVRGIVGNKRQLEADRPMIVLRNEPHMLCFICVLIPKWVQDKVGLLDERFIGYGFDDNDYCKRAKDTGVGMSVYAGCVVEHKSLPSTFRTKPGWKDDMQRAQAIFQEKYA